MQITSAVSGHPISPLPFLFLAKMTMRQASVDLGKGQRKSGSMSSESLDVRSSFSQLSRLIGLCNAWLHLEE